MTEADIDAMVENLRAQRPVFEAVEREGRDTDRVTMDFVGRMDGAAFEGSKGDDVAVLLGGGRMLKEFEHGISGMKAGERRKLSIRYPDEYHNKRGRKDGRVRRHMKKVEEQRLPELDDAFCRAYGVFEGGMEQLRREVPRTWTGSSPRTCGRASSSSCSTGSSRRTPSKCRRPGRCAGPRDADRGRAAHRRQGRLAGAAARAVPRAGAPPRRARHPGRRADQDARHADRPLDASRARLAEMAATYPDPSRC